MTFDLQLAAALHRAADRAEARDAVEALLWFYWRMWRV